MLHTWICSIVTVYLWIPTVNSTVLWQAFVLYCMFCSHAGLATDTYKYYNPDTCMFDPEGAYASLKVGTCITLYLCTIISIMINSLCIALNFLELT